MAVDTAPRRMGMLNFASISTDTLPIPDGTLGQVDWWHLLDLYSGFVVSGVLVILDPPDVYNLLAEPTDAYDLKAERSDAYDLQAERGDVYDL